MAPRIRALIAEHADGAEVVGLRTRRAARRFLAGAVTLDLVARSG